MDIYSLTTEHLLTTIDQLTRERAELLVQDIRARRIAAVERYKEAQRLAAHIAEEKVRVKADRLLIKIEKDLIKSRTSLEAAELKLAAFDIGNFSLRKKKD
jgi:hypothetical protein